ncbi:MAG: TetR/AcrR family transcriptional regulator [Firmicutes bacterium HGW-Firmicutes-7]|nr:MAG: TetR/AcrR family transcriptional regulator [Firmicutes bacterium HGW-Firmicutes-7]
MDNRMQIMEVALDLFSLHGFDAVGVQEIVGRAGITKPTLYHYFGSKSGLLQTILKENYNKLELSIKEAAKYEGDLPLTLHKIVTAYISFSNINHRFYRMHISMMYSPTESEAFKAVYPYVQNQLEIIEQLFILAVKDHGNMRGRHKPYALSLLGLINTYIQMCFSGNIALDNEVEFKLVHQFMHGIYS